MLKEKFEFHGSTHADKAANMITACSKQKNSLIEAFAEKNWKERRKKQIDELLQSPKIITQCNKLRLKNDGGINFALNGFYAAKMSIPETPQRGWVSNIDMHKFKPIFGDLSYRGCGF